MSTSPQSQAPPAADFEEDLRYRVSQREAWICLAYWASYTALAVAIAWLMGHRDASEIGFVMGFPDWFFWSAIALTAVFATVVPYFMVRLLFTDLDLEPRPEDGSDTQGVRA